MFNYMDKTENRLHIIDYVEVLNLATIWCIFTTINMMGG